jgi:uncharacterized protein with von Willebrand factor type A (vWA) domain
MQAGGSTNIARALRMAAEEVGSTTTGSQRIVLVTDGSNPLEISTSTGCRSCRSSAAPGQDDN